MKNVILGIIGCFIVLYTTLISLSMYNVSSRKNQMDKCLSVALAGAMENYYSSEIYEIELPDEMKQQVKASDVENEIISNVNERITSNGDVKTTVSVCDLEKGIISAEIEETFTMPMGTKKTISCSKTIIADKAMEE